MKKKILLSVFVLIVSLFVLSGCGKTTEVSQDVYKLPLGDVAYKCDVDFALKAKEEGNKTIDFNYLEEGKSYTINFKAAVDADSTNETKYAYLDAGYYVDEDYSSYISYGKSEVIIFTKNVNDFNYTFKATNVDEAKKIVFKVIVGTEVDEANNENYKDIKKSLAGNGIKISEVSMGGNSLLTANYTDSTTFSNVSLRYYNTAVVSNSVGTDGTTPTNEWVLVKLNTKTGLWQLIVEGLGIALAWLIGLVGGKYWVGLLIFTIVLRTAAWPIYAKSNAYSANMAKIQPEMQKIQLKYQGRTDQNSQMKQQMEMRELMKKNKVGVFGCLTPFLQMPIFIAVYQVVSRFPLTPIYDGFDYSFAGISFKIVNGEAESSWVLALFVGITMVGSQLLSMLFTKIQQKKNENFYTKQQNNKQQNKTMLIMMVVMTVMMVFFAIKNAGIAFYWVIGNLYQIGQTALSKYFQEKKQEKERIESGRVRGR